MQNDSAEDVREDEMEDELQFTCPNCGSHCFSTSGCLDWETAYGHCDGATATRMTRDSGEVYPPITDERCKFTWPRKTDDRFYFRPSGRQQPKFGIGGMVST